MEDSEVIEAFLEGALSAFGPALNVERGTLKVEAWWSLAFRVSDRTVLVRDEEPPTGPSIGEDLRAVLTARGMTALGGELPAIGALTYTNLDLGYAPWVMWSTDLATGEADLNARATEESFFGGEGTSGYSTSMDNVAANARSARRLAGDLTKVVLAVGLGGAAVDQLRDSLGDCRLESRTFDGITPDDCGALLPTLVLVDAVTPAGVSFVAGLQAGDAVDVPVVAVTPGGEMLAGADATVAAADHPDVWVTLIADLLR
ncbi:MAG: hypothetical protein ACRD12_22030 [Acidimicrobiales bacterium]